MRFSIASCCLIVIAVVGFFAADAAANGSCQTLNWIIDVTDGPCPVACDADYEGATPLCQLGGTGCTGIEYTITGGLNADHVVALVQNAQEDDVVFPSNNVFALGEGDNVTSLGIWAQHEIAVRLNPDALTEQARLVVQGVAQKALTTVLVRNGRRTTESCAIDGLGFTSSQDPNIQAVSQLESFTFKGCTVEFEFDPNTGEVIDFRLADGAPQGCETRQTPASEVLVSVESNPAGPQQPVIFGNDAIFTVGDNSCACRIIGDRAYHWCR